MKKKILKRDRIGRVTLGLENKEELLKLYDRSKLSGQAFARKYNLKYPTLAHWIQERREPKEQQTKHSKLTKTFAVAEVSIPKHEPIVVEIRNKIRIEYTQQNQTGLVLELIKGIQEADA